MTPFQLGRKEHHWAAPGLAPNEFTVSRKTKHFPLAVICLAFFHFSEFFFHASVICYLSFCFSLFWRFFGTFDEEGEKIHFVRHFLLQWDEYFVSGFFFRWESAEKYLVFIIFLLFACLRCLCRLLDAVEVDFLAAVENFYVCFHRFSSSSL